MARSKNSKVRYAKSLKRWDKVDHPKHADPYRQAEQAIRDSIPYVMRKGCRLCGGTVTVMGVWFIDGKARDVMDVPQNKQRCVPYGLCDSCAKLPDGDKRASNLIQKSFLTNPDDFLNRDYGTEKPVPRLLQT